MNTDIKIGDKVRSFDFPENRDIEGPEAFFAEGVVEGFKTLVGSSYTRFDIRVTRAVWEGKEVPTEEDRRIAPPLNGLPTKFGRITDGVVKIEEPESSDSVADMDLSNLTADQLKVIRKLAMVAERHFDRLAVDAINVEKQEEFENISHDIGLLFNRVNAETTNKGAA